MRSLRILLADGHTGHLAHVEGVVTRLGRAVVAKETNVEAVAQLSVRNPPDVAIVIVSESGQHALELVAELVREAIFPVIVVLDVEEPAFVHEAAERGVFANITNGDAEFEGAIDVVLHRFAEYQTTFEFRLVVCREDRRIRGPRFKSSSSGYKGSMAFPTELRLLARLHSRRACRALVVFVADVAVASSSDARAAGRRE